MERIPSLGGLRAISILLVIAGHSLTSRNLLHPLSIYSNTGVRVFFVISGYLITVLLEREHKQVSTINLRQFYVRRAYRIFPAAFAYLLPVLFIYRHEVRPYQAAAAILYVVNFDLFRPWVSRSFVVPGGRRAVLFPVAWRCEEILSL